MKEKMKIVLGGSFIGNPNKMELLYLVELCQLKKKMLPTVDLCVESGETKKKIKAVKAFLNGSYLTVFGEVLCPTPELIQYVESKNIVHMRISGFCDQNGEPSKTPTLFLFGFIDVDIDKFAHEFKADTSEVLSFRGFHEIIDQETQKVSETIITEKFSGKPIQGYWVTGIGIHFPQSVNYKGSCWIQGTRPVANDWISVVPESVEVKVGSQPWVPLQKAKE